MIPIGAEFETAGYDLLARARFYEGGGEGIVLNNNSTHYLVAIRQGDADDVAQLEGSYPYDGAPLSALFAYRAALAQLTRLALAR